MRRLAIALALALGLGIAIAPSIAPARPSERALVYDAFREFVAALGDRDAEAGVARLSAASLGEWQRLRAMALGGEKREVATLAPGRRLAVFALRHHAPGFLAEDGPPEALASHAIRAGLADRAGLARIDLADVAVQGERASGHLLAAGLPSGFRAGFVREGGRWRLDLGATLDAVGRVVTRTASASDSSENSVIAGLLALSSGRRPTDRIWSPLGVGGAAAAAPRAP